MFFIFHEQTDQQWRFFPVVFWILANDIFDPAAGRRLLPVIANFAFDLAKGYNQFYQSIPIVFSSTLN